MWAEYPGGFQCPLRPKSAIEFEEQGYRKAHQGIHILRDKEVFEARRQELLDNAVKASKEKKKDKTEKKPEKKK
jgi:hypothetical protein